MKQAMMSREEFADALWAQRASLLRLARSVLPRQTDAEDAVSEATLRAFERLHTLRDAALFKPWMLRIVLNCCRGQLRRSLRVEYHADMQPFLPSEEPSAGSLWSHLAALPAKYRTALSLHYYEGYGTPEIASILRIPKGTVTSRLSRGRALLRKRLEEEENDAEPSI